MTSESSPHHGWSQADRNEPEDEAPHQRGFGLFEAPAAPEEFPVFTAYSAYRDSGAGDFPPDSDDAPPHFTGFPSDDRPASDSYVPAPAVLPIPGVRHEPESLQSPVWGTPAEPEWAPASGSDSERDDSQDDGSAMSWAAFAAGESPKQPPAWESPARSTPSWESPAATPAWESSASSAPSWESPASVDDSPERSWESPASTEERVPSSWENPASFSASSTPSWDSPASFGGSATPSWESPAPAEESSSPSWESTAGESSARSWESPVSSEDSSSSSWDTPASTGDSSTRPWDSPASYEESSAKSWESVASSGDAKPWESAASSGEAKAWESAASSGEAKAWESAASSGEAKAWESAASSGDAKAWESASDDARPAPAVAPTSGATTTGTARVTASVAVPNQIGPADVPAHPLPKPPGRVYGSPAASTHVTDPALVSESASIPAQASGTARATARAVVPVPPLPLGEVLPQMSRTSTVYGSAPSVAAEAPPQQAQRLGRQPAYGDLLGPASPPAGGSMTPLVPGQRPPGGPPAFPPVPEPQRPGVSIPPQRGPDRAKFGQPPAIEHPAEPKPERKGRIIAGVLVGCVALLAVAFGVLILADRFFGPAFAVGDCVKPGGGTIVVAASCGETDALVIKSSVSSLDQCADQTMPHIEQNGAILCLALANPPAGTATPKPTTGSTPGANPSS